MGAVGRRRSWGDASFGPGWSGHGPAIRRAVTCFNDRRLSPGSAVPASYRARPPQFGWTQRAPPETSFPRPRIWVGWQSTRSGMRIAVIGTGIAGNAAAWTLSKRYAVTVYERQARSGGHSHTVSVDYDGTRIAVDIGFIVYNELNYPDLTALFGHLGVGTRESWMSFAVSAGAGRFEWKGGGG